MEFDLSTVYLFIFFVGLFFAIVSLVFSAVGGDWGGHHIDVGTHTGGDLLDHGDVVTGHQTSGSEIHFSPFSPQIIATFATAFGGGGYASYKILNHTPVVSVLVGLSCGLIISFLLFTLISKFLIRSQASSEPRTHELIGTTAEVVVGIPKGGTGEVGYTTMGSRYTAPAVSADGEEIPSKTIVIIHRITAGLFHVERLRKK